MAEARYEATQGADEPPSLIYEISPGDMIRSARTGHGAPPPDMVSRSLWELLGDGNVADVYRALLKEVRHTGRPISFQIRCDEPDSLRLVRMTMTPLGDGGVCFASQPLESRPQAPREFFQRHRQPANLVDICSQCGSFHVGGQWLAPSEGLALLGLFADDRQFRTWPRSCPTCRAGGPPSPSRVIDAALGKGV